MAKTFRTAYTNLNPNAANAVYNFKAAPNNTVRNLYIVSTECPQLNPVSSNCNPFLFNARYFHECAKMLEAVVVGGGGERATFHPIPTK